MRRNCDWFIKRAQAVWRAQPARSMLLMIPQGCQEVGAAKLVRQWVEENFVPPSAFSNHRPIFIELVSDGLETSAHVAKVISRKIALALKIEIEHDSNDFPTDILENAVEAATGAGAFPILMIQRFHAFANIRDGGMTSILSRLRTLESESLLTTLAFSPISYSAIRRNMDSEQPFLNSVYGDMHDEAVMSPLGRDDFLASAVSRGIAEIVAHQLFKLGGGPDIVFTTLLDLHASESHSRVARCADRAGPAIDLFLDRAVPKDADTDQLLVQLALGQLNPAQEAFLLDHPLNSFLCKRSVVGELICSSPVIALRILTKGPSIWSKYQNCLSALEAEDYAGAATLAASMADKHPRLAAFRELVMLRGAMTAVPARGLFGIDWRSAAEAMQRIQALDQTPIMRFRPWLAVVEASLQIVLGASRNRRLQADDLTRLASDPDVRLLLLFMIDSLVSAAPMAIEPSARVNLLVNVPEAILQTLGAGFCFLDFSCPPSPLPVADYDGYFGSKEPFILPANGRKLTLASLLVVVPALLAEAKVAGASTLVDPTIIRPLHQKLVDAVRNPASHTIADFVKRDADMLEKLCTSWVSEWCCMENLSSTRELPVFKLAPDSQQLRALMFGDDLPQI